MKPKSLKQMAVMNLEKGEQILCGWTSAHIPQVGGYNLRARKRRDSAIEWAHFVQRDSGLKENVYHCEMESPEKLDEVREIMNGQLKPFFGITINAADYDMYTPGGKDTSKIKH